MERARSRRVRDNSNTLARGSRQVEVPFVKVENHGKDQDLGSQGNGTLQRWLSLWVLPCSAPGLPLGKSGPSAFPPIHSSQYPSGRFLSA